jgi:hypothetical protein
MQAIIDVELYEVISVNTFTGIALAKKTAQFICFKEK